MVRSSGRERKQSSKIAFLENHSEDWEEAQAASAAKSKKKGKISKKSTNRSNKKKSKSKGDGPKRPTSAYIYFSKDTREEVKDEFPNAKFGEIAKILGEWWTDATAKERRKYEQMAAEDKERYECELEYGVGSYEAPVKSAAKQSSSSRSRNSQDDGKLSYYDMAREALLELKDRKGSSQVKIERYIIDNFPDLNFQRHHLRKALNTATNAGKLERIRNSWKLSADEKRRR